VTRPSSTRTDLERKEDVALTWIEEWLRDIFASLEVMHEIVDGTPVKKPRLSKLEVHISDLLTETEAAIEKVEKL